MFQILMSVPVELITAVSMHPALTLWAATTVLAMLVMLEMGLTAVSSSYNMALILTYTGLNVCTNV